MMIQFTNLPNGVNRVKEVRQQAREYHEQQKGRGMRGQQAVTRAEMDGKNVWHNQEQYYQNPSTAPTTGAGTGTGAGVDGGIVGEYRPLIQLRMSYGTEMKPSVLEEEDQIGRAHV